MYPTRGSMLPKIPVACDSLVALGNSTADGSVVFAKNSDRPANECQPLTLAPRQAHAAGSALRCTYIEIPQSSQTARVLGSRPYWCWGFEHGVNEHGVAIGNHSVFTKDVLAGKGLIGMDLVRLGLERGHSADDAAQVITSLLERHGQGGSGYADKEWPYHNSFLIADRSTAIVLETSDREWAWRRATDVAAMSNHLSVGANWDAISATAENHATEHGWWPARAQQRFDFAAAYRDVSMAPETISSGRYSRNCLLLESTKGTISIVSLRGTLRDHYGSPVPRGDLAPDRPEHFSVCMHAEPVGTTTASLIVRLSADPSEPLVYWASLGSPCVGVFLPLFVDCNVPTPLLAGAASTSADSAWWQFKKLLTRVEAHWDARLPKVRAVLDEFESTTLARMDREQIVTAAQAERENFVEDVVGQALRKIEALTSDLA